MKTNKDVDFLFVYGTLRRGANGGMHHLLARNSTFIGDATYQGKLYLVGDYPAAVSSCNPEDYVLGEVYRIHDLDLIIPQLDDYEGCDIEFLEPTEYVRRIENVTIKTSEIDVPCNIYIYNWTISHLKEIPSGNFFDVDIKCKNPATLKSSELPTSVCKSA